MRLITEPYLTQVDRLPKVGNHILAQFDEDSIVVYQAYRSAIGEFAATQGYFGGEFSLHPWRSDVLKTYAQEWIIEIEDISDFVQQQRQNIVPGCTQLIAPRETVYPVLNLDTAIKLELASNPACN